MPQLFDMNERALRRDRAAQIGPELFLYERAFEDCLERIRLQRRQFDRALLIGCPDPEWPKRLGACTTRVDIYDPGARFASLGHGALIIEDKWEPARGAFDLVLAIGTLDTVNDLPLAVRLIGYALRGEGLFIGAMSGGDTLPQLRAAMRAADAVSGAAAPHVHPRIEPAALAALLADADFVNPVVDVDRVPVSYPSLERLISDLRAMGATNLLSARPTFVGREARLSAMRAFSAAGDGLRTVEIFEFLHFAAWTAKER